MKTIPLFLITLFLTFTLLLPNAFAQDYTTWSLPDGAAARLGKGEIRGDVAFAPDGNRLAVPSSIGIWIYDARPGKVKELDLFTGHTGEVTALAFSPDGATLASANWDGTLYLWNAVTGEQLFTLEGHKGGVRSIAFSPDGKTVASGSNDKTVRLWDAKTGNYKSTLSDNMLSHSFVAFAPDGEIFAFASPWVTFRVQLWNTRTWRHIGTLEESIPVNSVAFSPDSSTLASVVPRKSVQLWDLNTRKRTAKIEGHTKEVTSAAFSPDGTILATGSNDKTVRLWDLRTKKHIATFKGHTCAVSSVAFSPDSNTIASISWDGTILLWKIR